MPFKFLFLNLVSRNQQDVVVIAENPCTLHMRRQYGDFPHLYVDLVRRIIRL